MRKLGIVNIYEDGCSSTYCYIGSVCLGIIGIIVLIIIFYLIYSKCIKKKTDQEQIGIKDTSFKQEQDAINPAQMNQSPFEKHNDVMDSK